VNSAVTRAVHYMCVQFGGKGDSPGDVHARWEKDVHLGAGSVPLHVALKFQHPADQLLDSVTVSGCLLDVGVEASHRFSEDHTDVTMAYSLPGGTQLTADANVAASDGSTSCSLQEVSAFHVAGPFNVQPAWLPAANVFRLKLGRGAMRRRCPVSLQADVKPGSHLPNNYEIGVRHQFGRGRKLRARLLLPEDAPGRKAWLEYQDDTLDKRAVWFVKAALSLDGASSKVPELSLRRAWQW